MDDPQTRRKVLILASAIDMMISGAILLIYFGLLPVDISGWDVPRWVIGLVGGAWFAVSMLVLAYQLTKTESG